MGEEFEQDSQSGGGQDRPASNVPGNRSGGPSGAASDPGAVPPVPVWPVRARRALTAQRVIEACEAEPESELAARALAIHDNMRERTKLYAREQELLTAFLTRDPESDGCIDSADISALKVATGLRASLHRAECLIRDAHRSVTLMPGTFESDVGPLQAAYFVQLRIAAGRCSARCSCPPSSPRSCPACDWPSPSRGCSSSPPS